MECDQPIREKHGFPLVNIQKAIENDHLFQLVIFHSYFSLPEGTLGKLT